MPILETVTACALTLACSGGPTTTPDHTLALFMQEPDGATSSVVLECDPAGGTHPAPEMACDQLRAVGGQFTGLPGELRQCILMYAPVDVRAIGHWEGEFVNFEATYANRCVAGARTGGVFDF